jgi:hypothetical protein
LSGAVVLLVVAVAGFLSGQAGQIAQRHSREGLAKLPLAAQGAVSAALGANDPAYRVRDHGNGLYALSPEQHFRVSFTGSGASVKSPHGWLSFALAGVGYGRFERPLTHVARQTSGNRVAYRFPLVSEWYTNGPLGLEQGFGVVRPLAGAGRGPLMLSLALGGDLRPVLGARGREVLFVDTGGRAVLRYGGLAVTDARGRMLRAWLALRGRSLRVAVDAQGARYPLRIDPTIQAAELAASDGADGDQLGDSVAISGSTIAVGAPQHAVAGHQGQGAVYVFSEPRSGNWQNASQTAELTASGGASGDGLGSSVAISGSTIVAGAPDHGSGGALYVFSQSTSGRWRSSTQAAELTASDGAAGDELGSAVAISGGTIAAGAPEHSVAGQGGQGAAYVFSQPGGGWRNSIQSAELTASDGTSGDELGYSVGISGSTIAAGAIGHAFFIHGSQGAVYAFSKPAGGWRNATQTAELIASDGAAGDGLGDSVAVSGSTIAAGCILHAVGANSQQGAVYVFSEPAGGWKTAYQTAELTASDGAPGDDLGYSVAISGTTIAAGAPEHTVGGAAARGAVYMFSQPAVGGWKNATQGAKLTASGGGVGDELGSSMAISGSTIAGGAPGHSVFGGAHPGSVYVFASPKPPPPTLTDVRQSHSRWRERSGLETTTRHAPSKLPLGTTFSFALNVEASVAFAFTQRIGGRKIGRECVAQTSKNRRRPPCKRTVTRGVLFFIAHPGKNKVFFEGVLSRKKKLSPGAYTLTIYTAAAGGTSQPRSLSFTIV